MASGKEQKGLAVIGRESLAAFETTVCLVDRGKYPPPPPFCVSVGMIGVTGESLVCVGMIGLRGELGEEHTEKTAQRRDAEGAEIVKRRQ